MFLFQRVWLSYSLIYIQFSFFFKYPIFLSHHLLSHSILVSYCCVAKKGGALNLISVRFTGKHLSNSWDGGSAFIRLGTSRLARVCSHGSGSSGRGQTSLCEYIPNSCLCHDYSFWWVSNFCPKSMDKRTIVWSNLDVKKSVDLEPVLQPTQTFHIGHID